MRLESIEIRGMHRIGAAGKVYRFNEANYLTGPNGAGKSTVLQAIQLALLGYIPGTDKKPAAIFAHACAPTMSVTAVINNEPEKITITRTYKSSGSSVTSSCVVTPNTYVEQNIAGWLGGLEIPVFNFGEFMGMTANKLKEWFIGFLPKSSTSADWSKVFVDENRLTAPYTEGIRQKLLDYAIKINAVGIEGVISMNEYTKATGAATKADLARVMSTLQELTYYDDVDTTVCTSEEAQKSLSEAQAEQMRLNTLLQRMEQRDRIQKSIDDLGIKDPTKPLAEDPDYTAAVEKRDAAQKQVEVISTEYVSHGSEITRLESEIFTLEKVIKSGGVCPFTSTACDTIGTLVKQYQHDVYAKKDEVTSHTAQRAKLKSEQNLEEAAYKSANQIINQMELDRMKYNTLVQQMPQMEAIDADDLGARIIEVAQTIKDRTDLMIKVKANERYTQLSDKLKNDKARLECEIDYLKIIYKKTSTSGLQSQLAEEAFITFIDKMNPTVEAVFGVPGVKAKFNLVEKANTFSVGLFRGDMFTPYDLLSSGEKCLFTFALVSTLIQVSEARLPIMLMDDLVDHLDADNAESFFDSLGNVGNVQAVIAGVQPYTSKHEGVVIDIKE
jgi:DNA repair exonuclease SbcCD ATPase subunit